MCVCPAHGDLPFHEQWFDGIKSVNPEDSLCVPGFYDRGFYCGLFLPLSPSQALGWVFIPCDSLKQNPSSSVESRDQLSFRLRFVTPAKAGVQCVKLNLRIRFKPWMPA